VEQQGLVRPPEDARRLALLALFHQLNGGMHNAGMSIELMAGESARAQLLPEQLADVAWAGLAGIAKASRALQILACLLDIHFTQGRDPVPLLLDDVSCILNLQATNRHLAFRYDGAKSFTQHCELDVGDAARVLVDGLAAITSAACGSDVRMELRPARDDQGRHAVRFSVRPGASGPRPQDAAEH
jgi:hypothetical protein